MIRMKRKILSLLMTAAMITTLFAGMTISASATTTINSQSDLQNATGTGIYVLGQSFNVDATTWSPINFQGTLEGAGKTITWTGTTSNSRKSLTSGSFGLFASNSGTIENLTVSGNLYLSYTVSSNADYFSSIVANNAGTIDKVINNTTFDLDSSYAFNIGGVAGFNTGYILNSSNSGVIKGYKKVGGIVGENDGTVNSCSNSATVTGLYNSKNGVGGIAGFNGDKDTPTQTGYIWNCYNTGDVVCSSTGAPSSTSGNLGSWVGGITGFNNAISAVANCYSTGNVNAYNFRDYIVGKNEGTVSNNYAVPGSNTTGYFAPQGYDYTIVLTTAELAANNFYQTLGVSNTARWQNGTPYPELTNTATTNDYSLVPHFTYTATKVKYAAGQTFDTSTLTVKAVYNDSTPTEAVVPSSDQHEHYVISPSGALSTSDTSISVSGRYRGVPISLSIPITVGRYSFELSTLPTITTYTAGSTFNASGAVVTVKENNVVVATITSGFTVSQTGPLTTTDTSIALSGTYGGENYSVDVPITVNAATSASLGTGYFTDLERALDAVSSGGTINVYSTISITGAMNRNDNVTIQRASDAASTFTGPLFTVAAGDNNIVNLTTMTIKGGNVASLFNVTSGKLRLRGNVKLQNCTTAVNVQSGATVEVNKATISATNYSIYVNAGGTFIFNDFGGTIIEGTVYLANTTTNDAYMTLSTVIPSTINNDGYLTIQCLNPVSGTTIVGLAAAYSIGTVKYIGNAYTISSTYDSTIAMYILRLG